MPKPVQWPRMFYHPKHGGYVVCDNPNEVPEGFVDNPAEVEDMQTTFEGPLPCRDVMATVVAKRNAPDVDEAEDEDETPPPAKKAPAKKAPAKKSSGKKKAPAKKSSGNKKAPAKKADEVTLESLKLTREEAIEILEDEGVEFAEDASDGDIAAKVKELM